MHLSLVSSATGMTQTRRVILLAAGTLLRHMQAVEPARAFRQLQDFAIGLKMIRIEEVGTGVPLASPTKPGRVGHRKAEGLLTIDVVFNEMNMVFDRVADDTPGGRTMPVARDFLDTFIERIDTAMASMIAWCDRKDAWADRDHFFDQWDGARAAVAAGAYLRPYEFALSPAIRDTLDATWSLVEAAALDDETFEWRAEAYFLIRDVGWHEADYEADPSAEPTAFGQPARVANFAANIATAPAPDSSYGYAMV